MRSIQSLVRQNVADLKPYTCARDLYTKGIFLDANENSFGSIVSSTFEKDLNRYPDPRSYELKKALSKYLKVKPENIFTGVGSDEAIDLIIRVFVNPGEEIIIFEPAYGMYKVAAEVNNAVVKNCPLNADFQINFDGLKTSISTKTKIIFCCSPNNPTANITPQEDIEKLCKLFDGIVVVDEAYVEFSSKPSCVSMINKYKNLVVLRTFSKAWGLAGIRVGYAVGNAKIIDFMNKIKAPYNVNRLSSRFAIKALANNKKFVQIRKKILKERDILAKKLEKLGYRVYPSESNFLLVKLKGAATIVKILAEKYGIVTRDFSHKKGMTDFFRITVGTPKQNILLLKKLSSLILRQAQDDTSQ